MYTCQFLLVWFSNGLNDKESVWLASFIWKTRPAGLTGTDAANLLDGKPIIGFQRSMCILGAKILHDQRAGLSRIGRKLGLEHPPGLKFHVLAVFHMRSAGLPNASGAGHVCPKATVFFTGNVIVTGKMAKGISLIMKIPNQSGFG